MASPSNKGKDIAEGSSSQPQPQPPQPQQPQSPSNPPALSWYESQKQQDWNTFCHYIRNQQPPVHISQCGSNQILDFLQYLNQFGKTKVHVHGCVFFGQVEPAGHCKCPLKQAWGSLDALIGRLREAYEKNGGLPERNPFASGGIRVFLTEVRDSQAKARGVPYKKRKQKKTNPMKNSHCFWKFCKLLKQKKVKQFKKKNLSF
ncbi:hypothetical protein Bca52824_016036 [Brassica carinata]|uniref:ALOG domain-containing protein n=1 Tax=Brassica carinata TaxID=52824 RepID=A0A8X8B5Y9_BRACI|nr:hypothetical protein Bca52824_016036 [Brassica carinata]